MMKSKTAAFFLSFLFLLNACALAWADKSGNIADHFQQSFTYEAKGKYGPALDSVLKILQIDPKDYTANLRAGWLNYLKGSYEDSLFYYNKALSLAPDAIEPRLGLTLPMMGLKKWRDTDAEAHKVLKIDPKNYFAMSRLAFSLFSQDRYGEAERYYRELISLYPSDIEMKLGLGWTLLRMGKKERAKSYFAEVLRVSRNNENAAAGMEEVQGKYRPSAE